MRSPCRQYSFAEQKAHESHPHCNAGHILVMLGLNYTSSQNRSQINDLRHFPPCNSNFAQCGINRDDYSTDNANRTSRNLEDF